MGFWRDHSHATSKSLNMDAVSDLEDMRHVVADQDHPESSAAQLPDDIEHLSALAHAERRRRLVEDDDLAAERNRPSDGDRLPLPPESVSTTCVMS